MSIVFELIGDIESLIGKYLTKLFSPLIRFKHSFRPRLSSLSWLTFKSLLILIIFFLLSCGIFFSSFFFYTIIYHWNIPSLTHSLPVTFDFSSTRPVALIALSEFQWDYEQIKNKNNLKFDSPLLTSGQRYHMKLTMNLPDSAVNRDMGMITALTQIQQRTNINSINEKESKVSSFPLILASSTRSFMIPYRNALTRALNRIIWCLPMILSLSEDSHQLSIQLFDDFIEPSPQSTHIQIELATPRAQLLHVQHSEIIIEAHLTGLSRLLYQWPIITGISIITILFTCQMISCAVIAAIVGIIYCKTRTDGEESEPGMTRPRIPFSLDPLTAATSNKPHRS